MQPRWKDPMQTPEGELLTIVKQIEASLIAKAGMCKGAMCKNMSCMDDPSCGAKDMQKASMDEKNAYCQKTFGRNYSECTPEQKARCDKHCGKLQKGNYSDHNPEAGDYKSDRGQKKMPKLPKSKKQKHNKPEGDKMYAMDKSVADRNKDGKVEGWEQAISDKIEESQGKKDKGEGDKMYASDDKMGTCKTTEFLREKGIMVKWEQEPSVENSVPTFLDHSGGTPVEAINYHTNQTYPDYQDVAPKNTFISEKAQIPSVAQTGYDEKSSTLHMHLNDKGVGSYNYRAPIEESMMQLKKSGGYGNPGLVEEIAALVEQVMGRL